MLDAGHQAGQGVARQPQLDGERVGGAKADAVDVAFERVGVLADGGERVFAVLAIDLDRQPRRDLMALQKEHQVADLALLGPAGDDAVAHARADALRLGQPLRLQLDDRQRLLAEAIDDALGGLRPQPLDDARPQVLLQSLRRDRRMRRAGGDAQMPPVLRVRLPLALDLDDLADAHARQRAHQRHQLAAKEPPIVVRTQPRNRVVRLFVAKDDALDRRRRV